MNSVQTFRTLHEAIISIKETWPDTAGWSELRDLEALVPADPSALDAPLPDTAAGSVALLLEKVRTEIGPVGPVPESRPFYAPCRSLERWVTG